MINGIAAFQEQNGYLPECGNKSHPKLVLKRGGEFTHLNANDLERCSTALDEFKESKDEDIRFRAYALENDIPVDQCSIPNVIQNGN